MSHRTLSMAVRILAVVFVAAIAVGGAVQAGSQEVPLPQGREGSLSLPGGTVVLHFSAESEGQKVLDVELRCARPDFHVSSKASTAPRTHSEWQLGGLVDVQAGGRLIRVDVQRIALERRTETADLDLKFGAGAILVSGEEKVLFRNEAVTLRAKAVFEPAGS